MEITMRWPSLQSLSPFLRGAVEALLVNGLGLFAALAAQSAAAKALGPAGYGDFSAIVAVAAVMSVLAVGGMDTALLRELPRNPGRTMELVRRAERFLLLAILAGVPPLLLWFGSVAETLAATLLALFMAASTIRQFALRGNFIVFWGRFPDIVMRPVLFAGLVVAFSGYQAVDPVVAIALLALSSALVFIFGATILKRRVGGPAALSTQPSVEVSRRDRSFWLGLSLLTLLMVELDKLVGSRLLSAAEFGHYALASRLYGFGVMATESLAIVAAPIAARAIAAGKHAEVKRLERDVTLVLSAVVLGVFAIIHFFGTEILAVLAPGFEESEEPLRILACAALVAPFILPRLAIVSVVEPARAWKLQSIAVLALAFCSVGCTLLWPSAGFGTPAHGLAWGIVAGSVVRALLWRIFGRTLSSVSS